MKYKLTYVNKKRIGTLGKKVIIPILVALTVFFVSKGIIFGINQNKLEAIANEYIGYSQSVENFAETTNEEFRNKICENYNSVKELLDYVALSERLHDLNLDQYNLDAANISELFSKEDIELLIQKYETLQSTSAIISNEAYNLNAVVATLKAQEKQVNARIYNGYTGVEDLSLNLAKLMISKETGVDPANIRIMDFYSSVSSGQASCKAVINQNGKDQYYIITSNNNRELVSVAAVAFASQTQQSKTVNEDEKSVYNEHRNEFMKDGVKTINDLIGKYLKDFSVGSIKPSTL